MMKSLLETFPSINYINTRSLQGLYNMLVESGYRIFELDGDEIFDEEAFFANIVTILPLDPPLSGKVNWAAFEDSLWYGMDNLAGINVTRVAVLWKNAENMMKNDFVGFQTAMECFEKVASGIATEEYGIEKPMKLLVFMIGSGGKFVSLPLKSS